MGGGGLLIWTECFSGSHVCLHSTGDKNEGLMAPHDSAAVHDYINGSHRGDWWSNNNIFPHIKTQQDQLPHPQTAGARVRASRASQRRFSSPLRGLKLLHQQQRHSDHLSFLGKQSWPVTAITHPLMCSRASRRLQVSQMDFDTGVRWPPGTAKISDSERLFYLSFYLSECCLLFCEDAPASY